MCVINPTYTKGMDEAIYIYRRQNICMTNFFMQTYTKGPKEWMKL